VKRSAEIDVRKIMPVELKIPAVGESIAEVVIGAWRKSVGDTVEKDEDLVELETDKATFELPAPASGVLTQILKKAGETVAIGDVIGSIGDSAVPAQSRKKEPVKQAPVEQGAASTPAPGIPSRRDIVPAKPPAPVEKVSTVLPTGQPVAPTHVAARGEERIVPMSPIRRRIAQRLVEAQANSALVTTFNEIDMTVVMGLRKKYRDAFQEQYGVKLGFMSFFVKAVVEALAEVPQVNAEVRGTDVIYRDYFDIGIAVGSGKGLVVPVLRDAQRLSFAEIERSIADFARRAASTARCYRRRS
jgi:2-oxoglutarate dehydrogenase E2 component (dihydrolipoamide succinyltransferase)